MAIGGLSKRTIGRRAAVVGSHVCSRASSLGAGLGLLVCSSGRCQRLVGILQSRGASASAEYGGRLSGGRLEGVGRVVSGGRCYVRSGSCSGSVGRARWGAMVLG